MIFDPPRLKRLKKAYDQAVLDGELEFQFDGETLVVSYAKYLIEFLEGKMK